MYNYPFFSFPSFRNYNYYQSQHNKYTNNTIKKFQTKSMINEEKNSSNNKHRNFNTCIDSSNSHTNTNTNTDTNLKKPVSGSYSSMTPVLSPDTFPNASTFNVLWYPPLEVESLLLPP